MHLEDACTRTPTSTEMMVTRPEKNFVYKGHTQVLSFLGEEASKERIKQNKPRPEQLVAWHRINDGPRSQAGSPSSFSMTF